MAGINLSEQRVEEHQATDKKHSDIGLISVVGVFVLTLGAWGALTWYLGSIDQKIANLESEMSSRQGNLRGADVDLVADFEARRSVMEKSAVDTKLPENYLSDLEGMVMGGTRITSYNREDDTLLVSGLVPGYKELAQQMVAFKSGPGIERLQLKNTDREKESDAISFELEMRTKGGLVP